MKNAVTSIYRELPPSTSDRPALCYVYQRQLELQRVDEFWEVSDNIHDFQRCVSREEHTEMGFLANQGLPFVTYVIEDESLLDGASRTPCSVVERPLLMRGSIPAVARARSSLQDRVVIYNDQESEERVDFWPSYMSADVRNEFLKRPIAVVSLGDLTEDLAVLSRPFALDNKVFVKTLRKQRKGFAFVSSTCSADGSTGPWDWRGILPPSELCILTQPLPLIARTQHRCYVVDGEVCCASRHVDYTFTDQNREARSFAQDLADALVDTPFPRTYVIDVANTSDRGWVVVEFNAIGTTGRYVNNRVDLIVAKLYGVPIALQQEQYEEFQARIDAQPVDGCE